MNKRKKRSRNLFLFLMASRHLPTVSAASSVGFHSMKYGTVFLPVPKIDHPKPVFISESLRDELDKVARRLGGKRMSASGIVENMVKHHFGIYGEDMEQWFKL